MNLEIFSLYSLVREGRSANLSRAADESLCRIRFQPVLSGISCAVRPVQIDFLIIKVLQNPLNCRH
jgi:hypothetical protein